MPDGFVNLSFVIVLHLWVGPPRTVSGAAMQ